LFRAFKPAGGELKFPHKLPLNADERVCCITTDRIFFATLTKPKTKNGFLGAIIVAPRAPPHAATSASV
jgi:hypothetical protein